MANKKTQDTVKAEVIDRGTVDKETGEIITIRTASKLVLPDMKTVSTVSQVAGKNPAAANLRDHPEFSGLQFLIAECKFGNSDTGSFVVMTGWMFPATREPDEENDKVVIITGSDNVYQRVAVAYAENALPMLGTLRKSGRAWFLD